MKNHAARDPGPMPRERLEVDTSRLPVAAPATKRGTPRPSGRSRVRRRDRQDRLVGYLFLLPSGLLIAILVFIPFTIVLLQSMQQVDTGSITGAFLGLENFKAALGSEYFRGAFVTSLIWVFGGVLLDFLLGVPIALLLHRDFKGRAVARALVLFPYLLPTVVAVIVFRFMFHDLIGVVNHVLIGVGVLDGPITWLGDPVRAMATSILVSGWKFFPFVVIALLAVLQTIPGELYEAANVDGAGRIKRFRNITLPHIMPAMMLTALLRTIWNFDKFDIIYMMTGGGPANATTTVPVAIYRTAFHDFQVGHAAAMGLLMVLTMAVLMGIYLYLMRRAERKF